MKAKKQETGAARSAAALSQSASGALAAEAAAAMPRGGTPDERCPPRRARSVTTQKRGAPGSRETARPAGEKAVAPQAQGVFRGGVSSVASRSRRSVTASAQALDHSLPGRPESSFPPLGLLFPTRTASLGSRGGLEGERATEAGRVRRSGGYGPTGPAKKCHFRTGCA